MDEKLDKLEQKLAEVKQLYKQKYGEEVDHEDTDVQYDADGTPWIQISGTGVATDLRVERLEQLLSIVKDLYSEKYGRDVDTEYDADGTPWKVTEGTGVPRDCRVERLEQKLSEVKQLYKQKYGEEVDQEDTDVQYDADGTPWIQISGTGVATDLRVERLEQLLSTVKDLYSEKYGRDVDTEYDADGTPWKVTEGTGVPRDCRVERLEQKLAEVKQLYKQKYGEEVDQEDTDVQYDADGTPWIQISGTGVATDLRVERLEQLLSTVKDLYSEKYGRDVDTEYDADGTPWKVTEGTGVPRDCRVERLEQKLSEVKQLYKQKYGEEVDQEDTDVQYDAEGTPWKVTEGTGVPRDCRVERLEQKLAEVKQLYKQKYGEEVDQEDTESKFSMMLKALLGK